MKSTAYVDLGDPIINFKNFGVIKFFACSGFLTFMRKNVIHRMICWHDVFIIIPMHFLSKLSKNWVIGAMREIEFSHEVKMIQKYIECKKLLLGLNSTLPCDKSIIKQKWGQKLQNSSWDGIVGMILRRVIQ